MYEAVSEMTDRELAAVARVALRYHALVDELIGPLDYNEVFERVDGLLGAVQALRGLVDGQLE